MKRGDPVPLKAVLGELGVSRPTLWRASKSAIPGFPAPVIIRRLAYWRQRDIEKLDDALMHCRGRVAFERERDAQRRLDALKRSTSASIRRRRPTHPDGAVAQRDLFEA